MRGRVAVAVVAAVVLGGSVLGQKKGHLNPMVDLLEQRKPIFGTSVPTAGGGGGNRGGGAAAAGGAAAGAATTPAPAPAPALVKTPLDLAKDALAHPDIDYFFSGSMERGVTTPGRNGGPPAISSFTEFADALVEAGGIATKPYHHLLAPMSVKTPNISRPDAPADPAKYVDNISRQLNAGVASISFVEVDTAEELRQGIAAMRFKSKGGTRPDDIGNAPKYWGLSEKDYRAKADVWPLNPNGELVAWAIVESKEGIANVRDIAQVKGLGVLIPGAGTLGGVFARTDANGQPVRDANGRTTRDDVAWEAAIQTILAACKEFTVPCGYPAFDNDIEMRMQQGFSVFIIQAFNERGFKAVEIGRRVSGRDRK
jgi:2-keto-3-deoxy-L-rhamnonate aldolase RhmA